MPATALSIYPASQLKVIFIPEPLRVCGNCYFWMGPRVRNGHSGYAALNGTAGSCSNGTRKQEVPQAFLDDATPLSNPDCPIWRRALQCSLPRQSRPAPAVKSFGMTS